MVSDSGLHDLFEGVVDSSPHPAVDVNALHPEPDPLLCEVLALQKAQKKRDMEIRISLSPKNRADAQNCHDTLNMAAP